LDGSFTIKALLNKRREHNPETWVLFLDLVKAFDMVPRELLWNTLERFGVPLKLISVLRAMHKSIEVLFEVDGLKRRLSSTIGVKQGDLLGPELFTFFMAGVMETWRAGHDYKFCKVRTREDFILTGRNPNTGGKNVFGKQYTVH